MWKAPMKKVGKMQEPVVTSAKAGTVSLAHRHQMGKRAGLVEAALQGGKGLSLLRAGPEASPD